MAGTELLNRVVRETLTAVEEGQEAIFGIAEAARSELERLQPALEAAVQREAVMPTEKNPDRQDELEQKQNSLVQTVEQADLLLTRFGVGLQCLRGALADSYGDAECLPRINLVGQRVVQVLDNERRRIAREIHDGPAQALANILLRTVLCEQRLAGEHFYVQSELLELKEVIRSSLQDIRKILFDLRPKEVDAGLVCGLRSLIEAYRERYGMQVEFVCIEPENRLSSPVASALYRIVQEAHNNAWKHSGSDHIIVRLELEESQVTVSIYDDGKGFDIQAAAQSGGHYGLMNMRERACLLGGMLQINTAPEQGTQIIITIPIVEEEEGLG